MPGTSVAASFQDIEEADKIGIGVGMRIGQRITHSRLRREVNHMGKAMRSEQLRHRFAVRNVELLEPEVGVCSQFCNPGRLQAGVIIGVKAVYSDDVMTIRQ